MQWINPVHWMLINRPTQSECSHVASNATYPESAISHLMSLPTLEDGPNAASALIDMLLIRFWWFNPFVLPPPYCATARLPPSEPWSLTNDPCRGKWEIFAEIHESFLLIYEIWYLIYVSCSVCCGGCYSGGLIEKPVDSGAWRLMRMCRKCFVFVGFEDNKGFSRTRKFNSEKGCTINVSMKSTIFSEYFKGIMQNVIKIYWILRWSYINKMYPQP